MNSRDWSDKLERLRKDTEIHVDGAWQARIVANLRGRRRRFLRPALALSFACAGALVIWGVRNWQHPTPISVKALQFDANATGTLVSADSDAVVAEQTPERTRVALRRGSVHFEIGHTGREFRVEAGPVTVTVLGTSFTVTREPAQVTVAVQRGRVRVQSERETFELTTGERRSVAVDRSQIRVPAGKAAVEKSAETVAVPAELPADHPTSAATVMRPRVAKQVAHGSGHPAHDLASTETGNDTVEDLMRAADRARQTQDWPAALAAYGRIVEQHGRDSRAGLASFSIGRILLHQLHRPADAAHAFADARRLPLSSGLVREALLREIEAWHAASDDKQARAKAEEYVRRYSDSGAPSVVHEVLQQP